MTSHNISHQEDAWHLHLAYTIIIPFENKDKHVNVFNLLDMQAVSCQS